MLTAAAGFGQVDSPYEHVLTLGSAGGVNPPQRLSGRAGKLVFGKPDRASPLATPVSVAVDPQERIWITDAGVPGVHLFDFPNRAYRFIDGAGPHLQFRCPSGIDADSQGRIYVADSCSGHIFVFDADGSFLRLLVDARKERSLRQPWALRVSPDLKRIYVADPPNHKVVVLNQEGETVLQLGGLGDLETPAALAIRGRLIYVLDSGKLKVFSPDGALQRTVNWGGIGQPSAVAIDRETGSWFLGDPAHRMVRAFDESGEDIGAFGERGAGQTGLRSLSYLYVDAARRIYVVDSLGGKVLIFREAARNVTPKLANIR